MKNASFTTLIKAFQGTSNWIGAVSETWWKYGLLGIVDFEANYCIVKAYQYTSVTSVQVGQKFKALYSVMRTSQTQNYTLIKIDSSYCVFLNIFVRMNSWTARVASVL